MVNSSPGFVQGQIPTTANWNSLFSGKVDGEGGTLDNGTLTGTISGTPTWSGLQTFSGGAAIAGGSLTGSFDSSGGTFTGGTFTGITFSGNTFSDATIAGGTLSGTLAGSPTFSGAPIISVTATGAITARKLADRWAEWRDVRDYGAKGDGTIDDTAAIIAAAAAIGSSGGVLYFPAGTYLVSNEIALKSNTIMLGHRYASWVVAAPAASWPSGKIDSTFYNTSDDPETVATPVAGDTNIAIEGMGFTYPHGNSNYGSGGYCHILNFTSVVGLSIRNCVSDGGGDFAAIIACAATTCDGNTITNISNSGLDHWYGTTDARVTNNYITTLPTAGSGCAAIQFTGIQTGGAAATTTGLICTGNFVHVQHTNGQGIELNGHASSGATDKILVSHNKIVVDPTVTSWGILVTGIANHGLITHNYLEGGNGEAAIGVFTPATNWTVANNRINGWVSSASGTIQVTAPNSAIYCNQGANCSGGPFIGAYDATSLAFANDTGTGVLTLDKATVTNGGAATFTTLTAGTSFTSTGNATIGWNGAGGIALNINSAANHFAGLQWQTAAVNHWYLGTDGTTQSGSNAGDNLELQAKSDAGATLSTPLLITRSTGTMRLGGTSSDVIVGKGSAGTTTQTAGFLAIPFVAGAPTGVPANASQGIALVYDTTNHKLWAYDSGWKGVVLA